MPGGFRCKRLKRSCGISVISRPRTRGARPLKKGAVELLHLAGGPFLKPGQVIRGGVGRDVAIVVFLEHVLVVPLSDFGMSVGKRKAAGSIMVAGRHIHPGRGQVWVANEPTVVDAAGVFINHHPTFYRRWSDDVRLLA